MKRVALVLLIIALLSVPVARAQEDVLPLFSNVQPGRVTLATLVYGAGYNQREYTGVEAQNVAQTVKGYSGQFTARDRIQPYTWNFETWQSREYTPLVLKVSVLESWQAWENNWRGVLVLFDYQHISTLSCYDVGDPAGIECRQYQGSLHYEMSYHVNSVVLTREDVMLLTEALGLQ